MDIIRKIKDSDFSTLDVYWALSGSYLNTRELYPIDSSYVFERNGYILYAVAMHKIEGLPKAYIEYFIRNPSKPSDFNAVKSLQAHLDSEAKAAGIKCLYGLTKDVQVHEHHGKIGYDMLSDMFHVAIRRI